MFAFDILPPCEFRLAFRLGRNSPFPGIGQVKDIDYPPAYINERKGIASVRRVSEEIALDRSAHAEDRLFVYATPFIKNYHHPKQGSQPHVPPANLGFTERTSQGGLE
jgi:hypothetical protein